jgi:hypothetical protein
MTANHATPPAPHAEDSADSTEARRACLAALAYAASTATRAHEGNRPLAATLAGKADRAASRSEAAYQQAARLAAAEPTNRNLFCACRAEAAAARARAAAERAALYAAGNLPG